MTKNKNICQFVSATYENNEIRIKVKKLQHLENLFENPFQSKHTNIFISNGVHLESEYISYEEIYAKLFAVTMSENQIALLKIIHTHDK